MKSKQIVATSKPVTTVVVSGTPYHYFHSEALGKCRAIIISPDENLPRPTSEKSHRKEVDEIIDEFEQELAALAAKEAPKPLSKGDKLELLMNCSERLQNRIDRFLKLYLEASDYDTKRYWWEKLRAAEKADSRVIRKIGLLFV